MELAVFLAAAQQHGIEAEGQYALLDPGLQEAVRLMIQQSLQQPDLREVCQILDFVLPLLAHAYVVWREGTLVFEVTHQGQTQVVTLSDYDETPHACDCGADGYVCPHIRVAEAWLLAARLSATRIATAQMSNLRETV